MPFPKGKDVKLNILKLLVRFNLLERLLLMLQVYDIYLIKKILGIYF